MGFKIYLRPSYRYYVQNSIQIETLFKLFNYFKYIYVLPLSGPDMTNTLYSDPINYTSSTLGESLLL